MPRQVMITHDESLWPLTETCACVFCYGICGHAERVWGKHVLPCDSWRFPEGSRHIFRDIPVMKQIIEKSTQLMKVCPLLETFTKKYLSGKLTEIISSSLQWWDKSRMPLMKSLLALMYARPASIIPLHSFTNWWTETEHTGIGYPTTNKCWTGLEFINWLHRDYWSFDERTGLLYRHQTKTFIH